MDLNRSPENEALYPGRFETGLCPTTTFDGEPLYREGRAPDAAEVARRVEAWWRPYHAQLRQALDDDRRRATATPCCSTPTRSAPRSRCCSKAACPTSTSARRTGRAATRRLTARLEEVLAAQDRFTWVVNGRFKGGWTTRNYGRPAEGVHAVQFELVQAAYMDEANPTAFDPSVREADARPAARAGRRDRELAA